MRSRRRGSVRRLRAVVAFNHDDVGDGAFIAERHRLGVFRRAVARKRGRIILELEHDVPAATLAGHRLQQSEEGPAQSAVTVAKLLIDVSVPKA